MIETNFKHTEIGLIPHDWEVKSIADVAQTSSGGTPSRSVPSYYEGSIRWFTTGELCDGLLIDSLEHITPEALSSSSAKLFKEGTLLMAMYGATIGKLGILSKPSTTNQACCAIMCNDIQTKYLFSQLLFHRESIIAMGRGAGQPNISQDIVKRLQLPIPPTLAEQERIAGALSSIDTLIGALNEQIEKKQHIKQGTMQQLLTAKRRLKGFTGEWKSVKLGDILEYEQPTEYIVSSTEYQTNGIPVLTAGKSFILGYTTERYGIYKKLPVIIFDDFVTESKYVDFPFKVKSSAMKMLRTRNKKDDLRLIYEIMLMIDFPVVDHKRWWISQYSQIEINLPEPKEQRTIANILSSMDTEIAALEQKRDKYIAIKSGMMQDLLTGKIRLV